MVIRAGAAMRADEWGGGPRASAHPAAAPEPDERKLGTVVCKHTKQGGDWQIGSEEALDPSPGQRVPGPQSVAVEGWIAGVPVVGGVADSGWLDCPGGRLRLVVTFKDCADQREWVRARAYGDAYAREVLG